MKIKALGVNGAFTKYYHNNYVFELGNTKLLVDAGTTLRSSLPAAGYKESDITDIVITHLHSDHVGGLEEFAQRCKWIHNHKPTLWIRTELASGLAQIISHGLCTDGLLLNDYFNMEFVEDSFTTGELKVEFIKTDNLHAEGMYSMGLKVYDTVENYNVIFTGDIAKHEKAQFDEYDDVNTRAIFHDVSLVPNAVHSYIEDVAKYYEDKVDLDQIYAMHYQDDVDTKEQYMKYGINFVTTDNVYEF